MTSSFCFYREISTGNRASGKTEEQIRKERQYQQQRDKLKHFGKPSAAGLDPNKLVDSIFGTSEKPKPKPKNITSKFLSSIVYKPLYVKKILFLWKKSAMEFIVIC